MALIDKETIRKEIERRMFEDYNGPDAEQNETAQGVCAGILSFLDTLPEQPVEGLEEKIEKYFQGWINDYECGDALTADCTGVDVDKCKDIARHFAEWGVEHMKK